MFGHGPFDIEIRRWDRRNCCCAHGERLGDRHHGRSASRVVGRWAVAVPVVVSRMVVLVVADVEVEVENAGPELTVMVPVPDRMDAEATDADKQGNGGKRTRQTGTSDHGFTESTHLISGAILHEPPFAHPILDTGFSILDPPARP